MATAAPLIGSPLVERAVPARGHRVGVLEGAVGDEPQAPASRTRRIARVAFIILPVPESRAPALHEFRHGLLAEANAKAEKRTGEGLVESSISSVTIAPLQVPNGSYSRPNRSATHYHNLEGG
jgi:hypothetical protein